MQTPVGAKEPTTLDRRTCADIAVTAAPIPAIISSAIVPRGAVITNGSIVGVPTVIFIGRSGAQETLYRRVLLSQHIVFPLSRGVVPIPTLIVDIVLIFQFPVEKELEILTIGQGLIVL
jgi:hypothetical protein